MTISKTSPSPLLGLIPTEKSKKLERQIKKLWEMFDTRIDKDSAVNGSGKNMLKLAVLEQIARFEDEIGSLKKEGIDPGGPFVYHNPYGGIPQRTIPTKPPHHLVRSTHWSWKQCIKCGFKTQTFSDIRKNNGCNAFANYDSEKDHRFKFEDLNTQPRYLNIKEASITGCNVESRQEWVEYPETGTAIQDDKFINGQVIEEMKKYASI